jgi:hypothetical protein
MADHVDGMNVHLAQRDIASLPSNPPRPQRRPRPLPAARTAEPRPTPAGVCRAVESGTGWLRIRCTKLAPRTPFN